MDVNELKNLSFDEIRIEYKHYMQSKGLSMHTINTAYSDSFYIWKKESNEIFWDIVTSANFETDARNTIVELLQKNSNVDPYKYVSNYVSHLRRFRDFALGIQKNNSEKIVKSTTSVDKKPKIKNTKEKYLEETIIIERMYAGGYLGDNIGHEIINTFKTDIGENYIYISPWGIINPDYQNVKAVLLVRLINEHCYEVIGYASELTLLLSQQAMVNTKRAGQIEDERQQKIIKENNITYGGLPVNEIFSEQDNTVFVTFKADNYRNVKFQNPIYIVDDEKFVLNESYILIPEFRFSNQSLKLYAPKNKRGKAYEKLYEIVNTEKYWEDENTSTVISENTGIDSTFGILDIIGKTDDELVYSNWIAYYLKNYSELAVDFANNLLGVELNIKRLEVRREYHNIDLWLEDDNHILVIENKVKSGINGVDMERHDIKSDTIQSQLSKYYTFAETEAKKKNKETHYYIFLPDYSYKDEDLAVYLMADKYQVIRYSQLSEFFENEVVECMFLDEFRKALKKHATPYYKDLYQVMEERFVKQIQNIKR